MHRCIRREVIKTNSPGVGDWRRRDTGPSIRVNRFAARQFDFAARLSCPISRIAQRVVIVLVVLQRLTGVCAEDVCVALVISLLAPGPVRAIKRLLDLHELDVAVLEHEVVAKLSAVSTCV